MKKRVLSLVLIMAMMIGVLVPLQAVAADGGATQNVIDTSWYDASAASGTVFEIADAADLRGASQLSRQGVTFSGYDKNTVGNQTVTVTYKNHTTSFAVTVKPSPVFSIEATAKFTLSSAPLSIALPMAATVSS